MWWSRILHRLGFASTAELSERGRAALAAGDFEAAAASFVGALAAHRGARNDAELLLPLSGLTIALQRLGRSDEARRHVVRAIEVVESGAANEEAWIAAHLNAAAFFTLQGNLRPSLRHFERLHARLEEGEGQTPRTAKALFDRAMIHRWLHELERARELCAELPDDDHWPATKAVFLGRAAAMEEDWEDGLRHYERGLSALRAANPATYRGAPPTATTVPIVSARIATLLHRLGRIDEASAAAERAERELAMLDEQAQAQALEWVCYERGERETSLADALKSHLTAFELRQARYGTLEPMTTESRVRCAQLRHQLGRASPTDVDLLLHLRSRWGKRHPWTLALARIVEE